jgi:hypothetical protein
MLMPAAWPSHVGAKKPAADHGKRVRLHADSEAFGFTHVARDAAPGNSNSVGFGIGRPMLLDTGFVRPVWGIGLAYAFPGRRALLGARFAFAVDGSFRSDNADSITSVAGNLVPYFRWVFRPAGKFRPYIDGRFGLGGGTLIEKAGDGSTFEVSSIWPTVGVGAGVHTFVVDTFSFDCGLGFDYAAPHARTRTKSEGTTVRGGFIQSSSVFSLGVLAGFSVWFR